MFRILALAFVALLTGCVTVHREQSPLEKAFEQRFGDAVVFVSARYDSQVVVIGNATRVFSKQFSTGVAFDPRHVVTTLHGVDYNVSEVYVYPGDGFRYPARIAWRDNETDLAVLEIMSAKSLPASVTLDPSAVPVSGEKVVSLGFPKNVWTVSSGRALDSGRITDDRITFGSSGSPVFNESGEAVAIVKSVTGSCIGAQVRVVRMTNGMFVPDANVDNKCVNVTSIADFCKRYGACAKPAPAREIAARARE